VNIAHAVQCLRAAYVAEVARLAERYRSAICRGRYSGTHPGPRGHPRFRDLEDELASSHPFCLDVELARAALAVSDWFASDEAEGGGPEAFVLHPSDLPGLAAEGLARDVLGEARRRGWLRPGPRWEFEPAPAGERGAG